jgi:hypothetical protein
LAETNVSWDFMEIIVDFKGLANNLDRVSARHHFSVLHRIVLKGHWVEKVLPQVKMEHI